MNPMQMFQLLQNAQNPMALMEQMFGNHPMFQRAKAMLDGKSPQAQQQVLSNICQQRGIDIQQLMNMFQNHQ